MTQWNGERTRNAIYIRKGGPGNDWKYLSLDSEVDAPSGGGIGVSSRWGRAPQGGSRYLGLVREGDPERFTVNLMDRLDNSRFLVGLTLGDCPFDMRVQQICGPYEPLDQYTEALLYMDGLATSKSLSAAPATNADNQQGDLMDQLAMSFGLHQRLTKVVHLDKSGTVSDFAINDILIANAPQCAGDCGAELTGEEEAWAVTDQDTTPGYLGVGSPIFLHTTDGSDTWTSTSIDPFTTADATSLTKAGNRVIVASPNHAPAYADIQDIKDGVLAPNLWTSGTGISANFPREVHAVSPSLIFACGDGGHIYKSTDGGSSWTAIDSATLTTENLTTISFLDETLGWFAGASGALVKYLNGVLSLITTGITDDILTVAVPELRNKELYLGTDAGDIYKSTNADATSPTFATTTFDQSGNGSIRDIKFSGYKGDIMWVVQSSSDGTSRVLRDESGGALGLNVIKVGGFTSPSNFGFNAIAPANNNFAFTGGEVHETYAFIGIVKPRTSKVTV